MTRKELIAKITEKTLLKKPIIEEALETLGSVAAAEILGGGEVPFPGLGKLVVVETKARQGRNPRTGAPVQVPAGRKVKFRPGKELTEALKG